MPGFTETIQRELNDNFVQMQRDIDLEKVQELIFSGAFRPDVLKAAFEPAANVPDPVKVQAAAPEVPASAEATETGNVQTQAVPEPDIQPSALAHIPQDTSGDRMSAGYVPH